MFCVACDSCVSQLHFMHVLLHRILLLLCQRLPLRRGPGIIYHMIYSADVVLRHLRGLLWLLLVVEVVLLRPMDVISAQGYPKVHIYGGRRPVCTPACGCGAHRWRRKPSRRSSFRCLVLMVSITWHTRNTWEYTGKKGGFGRKGYVACTGGYECIMHNACIGGLGNTSSLPIVMINFVFENTPFWALGVYGRILKAPIPQYTAVYSGVYGRILRVYGRILGVFVCTMWLFQVEKFHCCAFCAHLVAFFAFAQQLHTT